MPAGFRTFLLLVASNVFMTTAWYWHLRFPKTMLWKVILISWCLAGVEYCLAVPANRIGYTNGLTGGQLKIMQEAITMCVFLAFATLFLHEPLKWNVIAGVVLILAGVAVAFYNFK